jgi:hypothetical protein
METPNVLIGTSKVPSSKCHRWIHLDSALTALNQLPVSASRLLVINSRRTTIIKDVDNVPELVGLLRIARMDDEVFFFADDFHRVKSTYAIPSEAFEITVPQPTALAVKNPKPDKIYLTGKMTYTDVTRKPRGKPQETVTATVLASEPDEDGVRWLGLYDVVQMYTGRKRNAIEKCASRNCDLTNLTKCQIEIARENVLTKIGSGAWRPTPAIRSTDLAKVGVVLNASLQNAAASSYTRLVGGDLTLVEEAVENRARSKGLGDDECKAVASSVSSATTAILEAKSTALAVKNPKPDKIYLTGKMTYTDVTRKPRGKPQETVTATVLASEPDEDGVRWLGLYDVVQMYTGALTKTIQNTYGKNDSHISGLVSTDRQNVFTLTGNNTWRPTPAIRSTDLAKVGVALNASLQNAAASSYTRLVGGDLTLIEEAVENRARQELLAERDPTNILRVAGELVEGDALELKQVSDASREAISRATPEDVEADVGERAAVISEALESGESAESVMRRLRGPTLDAAAMIKSHLPPGDAEAALVKLKRGQSRNCFYVIYFKSPPISEVPSALLDSLSRDSEFAAYDNDRLILTKSDAPNGFLKIGITEMPARRFGDLLRQFAMYASGVQILRCEDLSTLAPRLETKVFQSLREGGLMPDETESYIFAECKPGRGSSCPRFKASQFTETVKLTDDFTILHFDKLVDSCKSQLGVPLVGQNVPTLFNPKSPRLDKTQLMELELEKVKAELKKSKIEALLAALSPEKREAFAERMLEKLLVKN